MSIINSAYIYFFLENNKNKQPDKNDKRKTKESVSPAEDVLNTSVAFLCLLLMIAMWGGLFFVLFHLVDIMEFLINSVSRNPIFFDCVMGIFLLIIFVVYKKRKFFKRNTLKIINTINSFEKKEKLALILKNQVAYVVDTEHTSVNECPFIKYENNTIKLFSYYGYIYEKTIDDIDDGVFFELEETSKYVNKNHYEHFTFHIAKRKKEVNY